MDLLTDVERYSLYRKIDDLFISRDRKALSITNIFIRNTKKGIWGPSSLNILYELFSHLDTRGKNFIDLGSGDSRVVMLASLFFEKASGIEFDKDLIDRGEEISQLLDLGFRIEQGDFMKRDLSRFDYIFINPDKGFHNGLEFKLLKELKGELIVYNDIFLPDHLKISRRVVIKGVPVTIYSCRQPHRGII